MHVSTTGLLPNPLALIEFKVESQKRRIAPVGGQCKPPFAVLCPIIVILALP
jgi:hypothetical protein